MNTIDFEKAFMKSKGQPVTIQGQQYSLLKHIRVNKKTKMTIRFISSNGPYRQGIHVESDGPIEINRKKGTSFILWQETAPETVSIHIPRDMEIKIWNVWDTGNGVVESWHNGAAMIVEEEADNSLLFRCNDGRPNNDCDDLVFRIALGSAPEENA